MLEEKKTGEVVWFDARKGYGFLKQDNSDVDIFLHWSNINVDGFKTVKPNQRVSYKVGENHKGQQAIDVELLDDPDKA